MSDKHYVITIERQYGSGGRITGMRLAEELGIHYYASYVSSIPHFYLTGHCII